MNKGLEKTPQVSFADEEPGFSMRIVDNISIPIAYINKNLTCLRANKAALEMLGYPEEEVIGRPLIECVKENVSVYEAVKEVLVTGRPFSETIPYTPPAAIAERYFTVGYLPDTNAEGEVQGVTVTAFDVTELEDSKKTISEAKRLSDALNDINAVINSTLDVDEIMRRVAAEAAEATGASAVGVSQLEDSHWILRYAYNCPEHFMGKRFSTEEVRISAIAAEVKIPLIVNDIYADPLVNRELMESANLRSLIAVPLLLRDGVLGVLLLFFPTAPLPFGEVLIDFSKKLGLAVSLAIENSHLFAAKERAHEKEAVRSKQLEIIHEATVIATSSLDIAEVSQRVLNGMAERFGLVAANLFVADEDHGCLLQMASFGYPPELQNTAFPISICSESESARVYRSGTPATFSDDASDPRSDASSEGFKAFERNTGKSAASCIILPLIAYRKTLGTMNLIWPTPRFFSEEDIDFFASMAHEIAVGLENSRLHGLTEEELTRTRLLQDVAVVAATEASVKGIADRLLEQLKKHMALKAGDLKVLDFRRKVLNQISAFGYHPQTIKMIRELPLEKSGFLSTEAIRRNAILTHNDEELTQERIDMLEEAGLKDARYVSAPLVYMGKTTGVFSLVFEGKRDFSKSELDLFNAIRHAVGQAIEHARMYEAEHHIAETLQKMLLLEPEIIHGLDYDYRYQSATEAAQVCGDFYDIFEIEPGKVAVLIGDVSGKGIEAGTMTAVARNSIKAYAYQGDSPDVVLAKTNDLVVRTAQDSQFVTAFFGIIDLVQGRLTYASAGHPPVLLRRKSGDIEKLEKRSLILGAFEERHYAVEKKGIEKGDQLILYTDGVIEARRNREFYGEERLVNAVRNSHSLSAGKTLDVIMDDVQNYTGGALLDDVALLAVSIIE